MVIFINIYIPNNRITSPLLMLFLRQTDEHG